jgi:hypothetical protein
MRNGLKEIEKNDLLRIKELNMKNFLMKRKIRIEFKYR